MRYQQLLTRSLAPVPDPTGRLARSARRVSIALWVVQGVVALLFLMAGSMKLVVPSR